MKFKNKFLKKCRCTLLAKSNSFISD
uniref:Uncharacterized protein n=1 Tax=Anguilla anguilla TaxID=7936 RepID=A0A0E9VQB9_ANGAN